MIDSSEDRSVKPVTYLCLVLLLLIVNASQSWAEEVTTERRSDCRYEHAEGGKSSAAFPADDVFRPLIADPKQPQFFASWQGTRIRSDNTHVNAARVGVGENFGIYTSRNGCDGWQVGILGGIFSQFDLDTPSYDLINTDFVIGVPLSWRSGDWSTRVRLYHQSSHLGDEFLLGRPGFERVDFRFEEVEAIVSYDYRWARVYGGGGYLIHREPSTLDRNRAQWGVELRGPSMFSPAGEENARGMRITPVFGADFKAFEELDWIINTNIVGGVEWARNGSTRRLRFLINYYHGFNPYGQFFAQKIETVGCGLYLAF